MTFVIAEPVMECQLKSDNSIQMPTGCKQQTVSNQVSTSNRSLGSKDDDPQNEGAPKVDDLSMEGFIAKIGRIGCSIRRNLKRSGC